MTYHKASISPDKQHQSIEKTVYALDNFDYVKIMLTLVSDMGRIFSRCGQIRDLGTNDHQQGSWKPTQVVKIMHK